MYPKKGMWQWKSRESESERKDAASPAQKVEEGVLSQETRAAPRSRQEAERDPPLGPQEGTQDVCTISKHLPTRPLLAKRRK